MTPTQRTLKHLRDNGWTAGVVEKWNHHVRIRQDLWGFADLVAFRGDEVILVQATAQGVSARVNKILSNETAKHWSACGHRILVYGWRQLVARRKDGSKAKRKRWTPRIVEVTFDDAALNDGKERQEEI